MKDAKEQELIEARDEAGRKWDETDRKWVETDRKRDEAYRKWVEAHRKLREYRDSNAQQGGEVGE